MSDIVEDSRVHYIVKDYKRMYEGFHALVDENKELKSTIAKMEKEIANLEAFKKQKVAKQVVVQEKKLDSSILNNLNESMCQINSLHNKAVHFIEQTERLSKNIEELDNIIRNKV